MGCSLNHYKSCPNRVVGPCCLNVRLFTCILTALSVFIGGFVSGTLAGDLFSQCNPAMERGAIAHWPCSPWQRQFQRVQLAGVVELFGFVQSGPKPVLASGTLSMANGPA